MKKIITLLTMILLSACSSEYSPSEQMLSYKNNMSLQQAINTLQLRIWDVIDPEGICGSRGFWYDNNANMKVTESAIAMLSHKRGKLLKQQQTRAGELVVFEKQYYKYDFEFAGVREIVVYDDPMLLAKFPWCNKKEIEGDYFIIDLFAGKQNSLKFVVKKTHFDETMAALSIIMPETITMMN